MQYLLGNQSFFFLLFLCMGFFYLPPSWHELLGVLLLLPFGFHMMRYMGWWRAMLRAMTLQSPSGKISTMVNILLLLLMAAVVLSGAMISNHVFKDFIPLSWRMSVTAHQLHKSLAYILWIVTGLHVGLHLEAWLRRRHRFSGDRLPVLTAAVFISALGVYSSILHRIGDRLLLKHIFATPALKAGPLAYLGGLLAIFGLYMVAGWLLQICFSVGKKASP